MCIIAQSCPTLWDPMNCSLPGSSIYGIVQTRILEWVAISFSRGFSRPRNQTWVSHIAGRLFTTWATREAQYVDMWPGKWGHMLLWVLVRDERIKYTVRSELDTVEDSAYGVRSGRLGQEGHLPQLLGSARPRVCPSVDGWTGLDWVCACVQLLCPNRQHRI